MTYHFLSIALVRINTAMSCFAMGISVLALPSPESTHGNNGSEATPVQILSGGGDSLALALGELGLISEVLDRPGIAIADGNRFGHRQVTISVVSDEKVAAIRNAIGDWIEKSVIEKCADRIDVLGQGKRMDPHTGHFWISAGSRVERIAYFVVPGREVSPGVIHYHIMLDLISVPQQLQEMKKN